MLLWLTAGCFSCHCGCCCQVIRDYKLVVIVNLLLVIDLVILSTWQVVDPPFRVIKELLPQVDYSPLQFVSSSISTSGVLLRLRLYDLHEHQC